MDEQDRKVFEHYNKWRESLGLESATEEQWRRTRKIGQKWQRMTRPVRLKFDRGQQPTV